MASLATPFGETKEAQEAQRDITIVFKVQSNLDALNGNRTRVIALEGPHSTTELLARWFLVSETV